jgi:S-adenosylmethionine hydrolase
MTDIGHGVPPGDVRRGAVMLLDALPHAPAGVHLAVVDPGVGSARRPVAVRVAEEDRILVGPDNGLLWPAAERLGGAREAVDLARSPFRLEPVSATFHGRDLFAPVAAGLARGAALGKAGDAIEPGLLHRLELPEARIEPDRVITEVLYLDRFGNAILAVGADRLSDPHRVGDRVAVSLGASELEAAFGTTFGDVAEGEVLVYPDSSGRLAIAVNRGSAAAELGARPGDEAVVSFR